MFASFGNVLSTCKFFWSFSKRLPKIPKDFLMTTWIFESIAYFLVFSLYNIENKNVLEIRSMFNSLVSNRDIV